MNKVSPYQAEAARIATRGNALVAALASPDEAQRQAKPLVEMFAAFLARLIEPTMRERLREREPDVHLRWVIADHTQPTQPANAPGKKLPPVLYGDDGAWWPHVALVDTGAKIALQIAEQPEFHGAGHDGDAQLIRFSTVRDLNKLARSNPPAVLAAIFEAAIAVVERNGSR